MIATVHNVVIVPKGKEYNQLVFHSFTGVMAAVWDLPAHLAAKQIAGPRSRKLWDKSSLNNAADR